MSEDEEMDICESCGYETTDLTHGFENAPGYVPTWLCDLCSATLAGNIAAAKNGIRSVEHRELMQTICYVGNVLLAAIREQREPSPPGGG